MPYISIQSYLPKAKDYLQQSRPANVPGWSPDHSYTIKPLAQGEYNMNFIVRQDSTTWVLRFNTGSQVGLSDEEQIAYEYKTLVLLAPLNVAPEPYFLDHSFRFTPYGVLGMAFLPGDQLDYRRDNEDAARLMARYHQMDVPNTGAHLIQEDKPLTSTYNKCHEKLTVYLESDLADPAVKSYLREVLAWANQARHREGYYLSDPWNCLINTEVNSSNWIINRQAGRIHLVDWEKPLWGDPSRDLSHYRVPITTLWKTDYRMSDDDKSTMMKAYKNAIQDSQLRDTIEDRTRLRDPFNCLRGVSWSARAWVQYQQDDRLVKNPDTFNKLSMYVNIDFLRNLFDHYLNEPI